MNTTATTITNIPNADSRVFSAAELKLDKRTREAKSLATWQTKLGDLYMITTGYYGAEGSTPTQYSSKYAGFALKDTAAAIALIEEAKSLGVISEGKKEVHFSDLFFVDLYTLPEDASTTYGNTVSVLFGEHESEDYWKIRYATENLDNDPFFLARLAAAVADKKAKDAKAALAETARAEAEANIPVTRQMTRAIEEAERRIESIKNYTLPANPTPDNYKGIATKQATKRMLEMFVALCGSLTQELNGEYHRITPTEAFGMVVARTVNDSHYCPRELFADAVQEFKWNANINY